MALTHVLPYGPCSQSIFKVVAFICIVGVAVVRLVKGVTTGLATGITSHDPPSSPFRHRPTAFIRGLDQSDPVDTETVALGGNIADLNGHLPSKLLHTDYTTYVFDTINTTENMIFPDENGNTVVGSVPLEFSGLWWMDGNPIPDVVASFGLSNWQTVAGDGYVCHNEVLTNIQNGETFACLGGMKLPTTEENVWSWENNKIGRIGYSFVQPFQGTFVFECGGNDSGRLTYCQVWLEFLLSDVLYGALHILPEQVAYYDMTRVSDDLWIRNSYVPLKTLIVRYYLKRIVNGNGTQGKYWHEYVSGGQAVPVPEPDIFGFGADTRDKVEFVPPTQFINRKKFP